MKQHKYLSRALSLLLVLAMLLGVCPIGVLAAETEAVEETAQTEDVLPQTLVYNFLKDCANTAGGDGYKVVNSYEYWDDVEDPTASELWKFNAVSANHATRSVASAYATLNLNVGAWAKFDIQVPTAGTYQPVWDYMSNSMGGVVSYYLAPVDAADVFAEEYLINTVDTYDTQQFKVDRSADLISLEEGEYTLGFKITDKNAAVSSPRCQWTKFSLIPTVKPLVYDFLKDSANTAGADGYKVVSSYEYWDDVEDETESELWKFNAVSANHATRSVAGAYATLNLNVGAWAKFDLQVPATGSYRPVWDYMSNSMGGVVSYYLAPVDTSDVFAEEYLINTVDTYASQSYHTDEPEKILALEEGEYTLGFKITDKNAAVSSPRCQWTKFSLVDAKAPEESDITVTEGLTANVTLIGIDADHFTVSSENEDKATAEVTAANTLTVTGVAAGETDITVSKDDVALFVIHVTVEAAQSAPEIDYATEPLVWDFLKDAANTAGGDGFKVVSSYDYWASASDDVFSQQWKFNSVKSGCASRSVLNAYATLNLGVGAWVLFDLGIPVSGTYQPVWDYKTNSMGGIVEYYLAPKGASDPWAEAYKINSVDTYASDGSAVDMPNKTVTVEEGEYTLGFKITGLNASASSGRCQWMKFSLVDPDTVEKTEEVELNVTAGETADAELESITAENATLTVKDGAIASAEVTADGIVTVTGITAGKTDITVSVDGKDVYVIHVSVESAEEEGGEDTAEPLVWDFLKDSANTAGADGYKVVTSYEYWDAVTDDVFSQPWKFNSVKSACASRSVLNAYATLNLGVGAWVLFDLDIPTSGTFKPVWDYKVNSNGGIVEYYLAPKGATDPWAEAYKINSVDTYDTDGAKTDAPDVTVTVEKGEYTLGFKITGKNDSVASPRCQWMRFSLEEIEEETPLEWNFLKDSANTAGADGYKVVTSYEYWDAVTDDVFSQPWKFNSVKSGCASRSVAGVYATLNLNVGAWVLFDLDIPTSGTFKPVWDYKVNSNGGIVEYYLAPKGATDPWAEAYKINSVDTYDTDGAKTDAPDVTVTVEKGEYTLGFKITGKNDSVASPRCQWMKFSLVDPDTAPAPVESSAAVTEKQTVDVKLEGITSATHVVASESSAVATAAIKADGILTITGVAAGKTVITVSKDGNAVYKVNVEVTAAQEDEPSAPEVEIINNSMTWDFLKDIKNTAGADGYKVVSTYDYWENVNDGVASELWKFNSIATGNYACRSQTAYGILNLGVGAWVKFDIKVPRAGSFKPVLEYYTSSLGGIVEYYLAPADADDHFDIQYKIGGVDQNQAQQMRYDDTMDNVTVEEGEYVLGFKIVGTSNNATPRCMFTRFHLVDENSAVECSAKMLEKESVTIDLNGRVLGDSVTAQTHTIKSSNGKVATGVISGTQKITITGVAPGQTDVIVYKGEKIVAVVRVTIESAAAVSYTYDFLKGASLTSSPNNYSAITSYDVLAGCNDGVASAPWCFNALAPGNYAARCMGTYATLNLGIGVWVKFDIKVGKDAWYQPVMDYMASSNGGIVEYYLAPKDAEDHFAAEYKIGGVDTYDSQQFKTDDTMERIYLQTGDYVLGFKVVGKNDAAASARFQWTKFHLNEDLPNIKESCKVMTGSTGNVDLTAYLGKMVVEDGTHTVHVENDEVASAEITSKNIVTVTGLSKGKTKITVSEGDVVICTIEVKVSNGLTYNFLKGKAATAGANGFMGVVTSYEALAALEPETPSAPWYFHSIIAGNYASRTVGTYALLNWHIGAWVKFGIQIPESGWYKPIMDYGTSSIGGIVEYYLSPVDAVNPWASQWKIGSVDTYALQSFRTDNTMDLQYYEAGDYILGFKIVGCNPKVEGPRWYWTKFHLREGAEPIELTEYVTKGQTVRLDMNGKLGETVLQAEDFILNIEDTTLAAAQITGENEITVTGLKRGRTEIEVVEDGDVVARITLKVKSDVPLEPVMEASVEGVAGQMARFTTHNMTAYMMAADGEEFYVDEVTMTYDVDQEGIVEIDEEAHTITGVANGTVNVKMTARFGDQTMSDTIKITVADVGENLFDAANATFETDGFTADSWGWQDADFAAPAASERGFTYSEVVREESGNHALKVTLNPSMSYNQKDGSVKIGQKGTDIQTKAGFLAQIEPNRMYEISFRVRTEDFTMPEGTTAALQLQLQACDVAANKFGTLLNKLSETVAIDQSKEEWTTYTLNIKAPIEYEQPFYVMNRIIIKPATAKDNDTAGYSGSIYFDDFAIREVGFDHVDAYLSGSLINLASAASVVVEPYATTGAPILISTEAAAGSARISSTDNAVVKATGDATLVESMGGFKAPAVPVALQGYNGSAVMTASVNIHGRICSEQIDVTANGLPDTITKLEYTLNGAEALTMEYDQVAEGTLAADTIQLNTLSEDQIREKGAVYFTTSDQNVAVVDQLTGNVTAVGEGTAKITVYTLLEGGTASDYVTVSVTDDTDLASLELSGALDYLGVGGQMKISVSGKKASGAIADMSKFPVAFSLDEAAVESGIATISEDGVVAGCRAGTITVTAAAGVVDEIITATLELNVVENSEMPGGMVFFDFTDGKILNLETATIEEDNIELIRELSPDSISFGTKYGINTSMVVGQTLTLDFYVPRTGWYAGECFGAQMSYGGISDLFIDKTYMGQISFIGSTNYYGEGPMGSIYLEAGVHRLTLKAVQGGGCYLGKLYLYPTQDPNAVELNITADADMLAGQKKTVTLEAKAANDWGFYLDAVNEKPEYTNYYILSSDNTKVLTVSGSTMTGVAAGTATVTVTAEVLGQTVTKQFEVLVTEGVVDTARLTADETTRKPDTAPVQTALSVLATNGKLIELPEGASVAYKTSDTNIASVNAEGLVTFTGKEGSVYITAVITELGRDVEAGIWFTVTSGKSEPTIFTYEEREIAQENTLKYDWAWQERSDAVAEADYVLEHLDEYYELYIHEGLPRSANVGLRSDPEVTFCRYCGEDLKNEFTVYPWIVDPINNPWKITCPLCRRDFPSNDFGAYYESGLDEKGRFREELADKSLLVNTLYPEMGAGWGVDDGHGYDTGRVYSSGAKEVHTYIAYYMHCVYQGLGSTTHDMLDTFNALMNAYLYTGEEKYGNAGAILLDRIADIYPEYDYYTNSVDHWDQGKIVNYIWEASSIGQTLAKAADAFWPCMDNEEVIDYLRQQAWRKDVESEEEITPEYVRDQVNENILLEIRDACYTTKNMGNFGMHQASMAYAAVALDRLPETEEMIDWIFRDGAAVNLKLDGGSVMTKLVDDVDRDGFGNEGSAAYNQMWYQNLYKMADALNGYDRIDGVDLWKNSKFVTMFNAFTRLIVLGSTSVMTGETGYIQMWKTLPEVDYLLGAFVQTGDRESARGLYLANGNTTEGLHADIFTKDPESGIRNQIQAIVNEDGTWAQNESDMMAGHGLAILRDGPETYLGASNEAEFSDYWMFFGMTGGTHGGLESLNVGVDAYGLILAPTVGYPAVVNAQDGHRMQFMRSTISKNVVMVDDSAQTWVTDNSFPYHFEDNGTVGVMDAAAPGAYEQTDIYRRTMVTVKTDHDVSYAVDFFRVLGGSEHVYLFHAASMLEPETEGLEFIHQPMGTYAGADIPLGTHITNPHGNDVTANTGSGYSWLDNVYRDADPETVFSVDFECQDFRNQLLDASGIHMKLTMLSEEPLTELAIADGHPSQNSGNPEHLKFMLARRSGAAGMDSLFTTIIEPYRYESYIAEAVLVETELISGTPAVHDRAAAIKVTHTDGREDYVVYATNPDCTYSIKDENGKEKFRFCGFTGVCTYQNDTLIYAYGNEVSVVEDSRTGEQVIRALAKVTGEVLDFTKGLQNNYTMTVRVNEQITAEQLEGRYIYVNNDGTENGAYQIYGAEVNGNTVVLDLNTQTLVREYVDRSNIDLGYIYNIAEGQTYTIPLSAEYDMASLVNYIPDQVVKAGYRVDLQVGVEESGVAYEAEGLVKGMKINASTGKLTWTTSK
ncbi:MAG: Ig-like domain-containing protein, partial [Oscillospiraceae bacterium]|nr:Ig-like domain-containing protein [Oscillospiraceae bacterium]